MTIRIGTLLLLAGLLSGCATVPRVPAADRHILVMIDDPDIGRLDLSGARSGAYRIGRNYPGRSAAVARVLTDIAAEYRLTPVDGWPMQSLGVHCAVFAVGPETPVDTLLAKVSADPRVESAQPMQVFELEASRGRGKWDDPYRPLQRSLEVLHIDAAHRWSTGRGVRVAVIDTGVDTSHPDLRGQVVESRDFVGDGSRAADRHGTAVVGVIASLAGNQQGIVGVAPDVQVLALRACEQSFAGGQGGRCTTFSLARAIDHAIVAGSDVLNLSLGGPRDRLLERLLARALERDIAVIAALGAAGRDAAFPASMNGVIAVGDDRSPSDPRWLKAPGLDVLTLVPSAGYDFLSGSSIAAAHVSGIVALLLEQSPSLHVTDIKPLLARTSRRVGGDASGAGAMVSACAALAEIAGGAVCDAELPLVRAGASPDSMRRLEPD